MSKLMLKTGVSKKGRDYVCLYIETPFGNQAVSFDSAEIACIIGPDTYLRAVENARKGVNVELCSLLIDY